MPTITTSSLASAKPRLFFPGASARRSPVFSISIDGVDINESGLRPLIQHIEVRDRFPGVSECRVALHNDGGRLLSGTDAITNARYIAVKMGWAETELQDFGVFKVQAPSHKVDQLGQIIEVRALSPESVLTLSGEQRRVFDGESTSSVVETLIDEVGLESDVDEAGSFSEAEVISGETPWAWMNRRAEAFGYTVWYDEGKVNFKKFTPKVIATPLSFRTDDAMIKEIVIDIMAANSAKTVSQSQLSFDGEVVSHSSSAGSGGGADALAVAVSKSNSEFRSASDIVTEGGQSLPVSFKVGGLPHGEAKVLSEKIDGLARSSGWPVVSVRALSRGAEFVKAGRAIPLSIGAVGEFSGHFLVAEATHRMTSSPREPEKHHGFTTDLTLIRSFLFGQTPVRVFDTYSRAEFDLWYSFMSSLLGGVFSSFASKALADGPAGLGRALRSGLSVSVG